MPDQNDVRQCMQKIEKLVGEIERVSDPHLRSRAVEMVGLLMEMHGTAIEQMLALIRKSADHGNLIIDRIAADELTSSLLMLYGMHPVNVPTRVGQALEKVRPYLQSHGGNVELIGIDDHGIVKLKLQGSCNGCPSSEMTLKLAIEEAIYEFAPDISGLQVDGVVKTTATPEHLVQLSDIGVEKAAELGAGWETLDIKSIEEGVLKTELVADQPVLLCRLGSQYYAYGHTCPGCSCELDDAVLEQETRAIRCGQCGQRYDIMRAGRALDHPTNHLEPFPLLVENGEFKIAVPNFN